MSREASSPGHLTRFQVACEAALVAALRQAGLELVERRVDGIDETYVTGRIADTPLEIFIYEDETQTHGDGLALYFEKQDYRVPETLIAEFVRMTIAAARNVQPG